MIGVVVWYICKYEVGEFEVYKWGYLHKNSILASRASGRNLDTQTLKNHP